MASSEEPTSSSRPQSHEDDVHLTSTNRAIVKFVPDDPEDPRNWPAWRKWSIVLIILPVDFSVSWAASGISPATKLLEESFGVSSEAATLGLSMYVLGLALGPMLNAPISEFAGRSPVYIVSYGLFLLFLIGTALAPNFGGFLALRFISALFSSVTIANLGGTIADLWHPHDTGIPMSLFIWAATGGSPTGYFLFSWVAQYRGWRDVFWALTGICGGFWIFMILVLKETRRPVLLHRRFKAEQKHGDNPALELPEEFRRKGVRELVNVALTRPFRFLFTEAIVIFGSLYNGYLYGLSFLLNGAFNLVFGSEGYGFSTTGVGLAFLGIFVGISCGPITNILQERYFQRKLKENDYKNIPEARVQAAMVAAVVLPVSLFWFAWTCDTSIHWIVPTIATAFFGWSFYTLILMTYTFSEDSYKEYSASALAALGLVRNVAGAGFPLFGTQMYTALGYHWASSLLGFLAIVLIPIPFVFGKYGLALRLRSPWARQHTDTDSDEQGEPRKLTSASDGESIVQP